MSAWSPHYVKNWEKLERVQHRFTRMVSVLKGLEYGGRLKRLNLMIQVGYQEALLFTKSGEQVEWTEWGSGISWNCGSFQKKIG